MKKFASVFTVMMFSVGIFAGGKFQAYLGAGQTAIANSGNAAVYSSTFETSASAGFRYFPIERFAIDAQYIHDTVKVGRWLSEHDFTSALPTVKYEYSTVGVYAEYWPIKDVRGGVFVFAGPQEFLSTGGLKNALGIAAGFGGQYALGKKFFLESKVAYWHVQDFAGFRVVNTYNAGVSIGLKF